MSGEIVVVGAGPAGLTAAHELGRAGRRCVVIERETQPGGLARTIWRGGYGFDIGGHRFFTKSGRVEATWRELLGDDFLRVRRLSRIYYNGNFFYYPLKPMNALKGLGLRPSAAVMWSYVRRKLRPLASEENFENYVINRFGDRLYKIFFKGYTEKVWGVPCTEITADWAAQRIRGLSLWGAVRSAVFGESAGGAKSLIEQFDYPRLGPGMLWDRMAQRVKAAGSEILYGQAVAGIRHDGRGRVEAVVYGAAADGAGEIVLPVEHLFSTLPLQHLLLQMRPEPPAGVMEAARALRYRDFITVNIALEGANPFPDQWIYIHAPEFRVGRIQNFRNWSAELTPGPDSTGIGMEYFCSQGDELWRMADAELCELAVAELEGLGLAAGGQIRDSFVVRVKNAYPFYDADFKRHLATIRKWLDEFENLTTIGRNGLHRYNNQDHSMMSAMVAVDGFLSGEMTDPWAVNSEGDYHEMAAGMGEG